MSKEQRRFTVDPAIIFDVIKRQAGSFEKAVLEGVTNAVDAGATRCDIELTTKTFSISDNGNGFRSAQEIYDFFEVFGKPHPENDGKIGKFRMGRGQLFSYGKTRWSSSTFVMDVDIEGRGLDYDLYENQPHFPGCKIEGTYYKPLSPMVFTGTAEEIRSHVRYSDITVTVNGNQINTPAKDESWDVETDSFWLKWTKTPGVEVWNRGFFVCRMTEAMFGSVGAVLVSKKSMALNFPRNDVMKQLCEVWKEASAVLRKRAADKMGKKQAQRFTDEDRKYLLRQFVVGEAVPDDMMESKIIKVWPKGAISVSNLLSNTLPIVAMKMGDERACDIAASANRALILDEDALAAGGVVSSKEFVQRIGKRLSAGQQRYVLPRILALCTADVRGLIADLDKGFTTIADKDLRPRERTMLSVAREINKQVHYAVWAYLNRGTRGSFPIRKLGIGKAEGAIAWTNGLSTVTIDRRAFTRMTLTLGGLNQLTNVILHEYIHDEASHATHVHDDVFHKMYHDVSTSYEFTLALQSGLVAVAKLAAAANQSRTLSRPVSTSSSMGWRSPRRSTRATMKASCRIQSPMQRAAIGMNRSLAYRQRHRKAMPGQGVAAGKLLIPNSPSASKRRSPPPSMGEGARSPERLM